MRKQARAINWVVLFKRAAWFVINTVVPIMLGLMLGFVIGEFWWGSL